MEDGENGNEKEKGNDDERNNGDSLNVITHHPSVSLFNYHNSLSAT